MRNVIKCLVVCLLVYTLSSFPVWAQSTIEEQFDQMLDVVDEDIIKAARTLVSDFDIEKPISYEAFVALNDVKITLNLAWCARSDEETETCDVTSNEPEPFGSFLLDTQLYPWLIATTCESVANMPDFSDCVEFAFDLPPLNGNPPTCEDVLHLFNVYDTRLLEEPPFQELSFWLSEKKCGSE